MTISYDGDPNEIRVHKKRDGFIVLRGPVFIGFLRWHEGIIWRLMKRLPKRMGGGT